MSYRRIQTSRETDKYLVRFDTLKVGEAFFGRVTGKEFIKLNSELAIATNNNDVVSMEGSSMVLPEMVYGVKTVQGISSKESHATQIHAN